MFIYNYNGEVMTKKDLLKQAIIDNVRTGRWGPGEIVNETDLSQEFGLSATPIREVILALENEGLLVKKSRGGVRVQEYNIEELLGAVEVYAELEGLTAKYATQRITHKQGLALEQAVLACEAFVNEVNPNAIINGDAYYGLNLDFHFALFKASGNQVLIEQIDRFGTRLVAYFRSRHRLRGSLERSAKEHSEVYTAIIDGNPSLAQELMFKHVMLPGDIALDVLNSMRN